MINEGKVMSKWWVINEWRVSDWAMKDWWLMCDERVMSDKCGKSDEWVSKWLSDEWRVSEKIVVSEWWEMNDELCERNDEWVSKWGS